MGMACCSSSACKAHSSWDKQFLISETSNDRDFKSSLPGGRQRDKQGQFVGSGAQSAA